jgi:hypothetical protein
LFQNEVTTTTTAAMQLSIALFAILSTALTTAVQALPMTTCEDQAACLVFNTTQMGHDSCIEADCEFVVCMTVNFGGNCKKTGSISHTCEKASDECVGVEEEWGGFSNAVYMDGVTDGYSSCQTVKANVTAEFLMKDGNGSCGLPYEQTASGATCQKLEDVYNDNDGSCTGNVGKECIWTVRAPEKCDTGTDEEIGIATTADEEEITTAAEEEEYLCL